MSYRITFYNSNYNPHTNIKSKNGRFKRQHQADYGC